MVIRSGTNSTTQLVEVQEHHTQRLHIQQMGTHSEVQDSLLLLLLASGSGHAGHFPCLNSCVSLSFC